MTEAPSNKSPINQAALKWLKEAGDPDLQPWISYLAQLAHWGLEQGLEVGKPLAPNQPSQDQVEHQVMLLLAGGPQEAAYATRWFLANPNLSLEEQATYLLRSLQQAGSPREAAQLVVEAAYDKMQADSPS